MSSFLSKKRTRKGYTLAEVLVVLMIVGIIIAFVLPIITRRKNELLANATHGKWACNGTSSATAADFNATLPSTSEWKPGCTFPTLPKNTKFLWVEIYGGGQGGTVGSVTPWKDFTHYYDFDEPVDWERTYNLNYYPNNPSYSGISLSLPSGLYTSTDADTNKVCGGYEFGKYVKDDTYYAWQYGLCTNYTQTCSPADASGDLSTRITTNCIDSTHTAGTYCTGSGHSAPPNEYFTSSEMVSECNEKETTTSSPCEL